MKDYNNMDNVDKLFKRVSEYTWDGNIIAKLKEETRRRRIEDIINAEWFLQQLEMAYIANHDETKIEETILLRDSYLKELDEILNK